MRRLLRDTPCWSRQASYLGFPRMDSSFWLHTGSLATFSMTKKTKAQESSTLSSIKGSTSSTFFFTRFKSTTNLGYRILRSSLSARQATLLVIAIILMKHSRHFSIFSSLLLEIYSPPHYSQRQASTYRFSAGVPAQRYRHCRNFNSPSFWKLTNTIEATLPRHEYILAPSLR